MSIVRNEHAASIAASIIQRTRGSDFGKLHPFVIRQYLPQEELTGTDAMSARKLAKLGMN